MVTAPPRLTPRQVVSRRSSPRERPRSSDFVSEGTHGGLSTEADQRRTRRSLPQTPAGEFSPAVYTSGAPLSREEGGRIPKLRAESQQIAAWKLLYRVQHPARYVSRLQTIPSSDIELGITHGRPLEAGLASARDPAAFLSPRAATGPVRRPPRTTTA